MEEMSKCGESCNTNNTFNHTYTRHHWRCKTETQNTNEHGDEKGEAEDVQVVIGSSISALGPVSLSMTPEPSSFSSVPAPATPDIVARHGKASATDANECSHSENRTCCRSLNLDTSKNEYKAKDIGRPQILLAYRRRHAKVQGTQKELFDRQIKLFMSRMNDIQGERKFSEWKGSVMDSIVGAYLAQNVNDAISSPAFMLLAAKFPTNAASVVRKGKRVKRVKKDKPLRMRTKTKHNPALLNDMKDCHSKYQNKKKMSEASDAVDWDSVRRAGVGEISKAIKIRGQSNNLAERIKDCLDKLVDNFGSTNMEWIRDAPPLKAKEYLMNIYGLGLKSVECIRLLTLRHKAFPIDRNAGRVVLRLGWFDLLNENGKGKPDMNSIQMLLWPHLSHLEWSKLYELHCQLITFGKVFCTGTNPHCSECPMREECTYFASVQASAEVKSKGRIEMDIEDYGLMRPQTRLPASETTSVRVVKKRKNSSRTEHTSIQVVKKRKNSLRTEHQVYVLPSGHSLLAELESIQLGLGDDPCLLAVWTRENLEKDGCIPKEDAVYGTLLIPARAATGGAFPLNGTFFQSNEVFADDESSAVPIKVPRALLSDLSTTTLYCGTNTSSICKGMKRDEVRKCYKSGFVCFRGIDLKTREPKPLPPKFHNQAPSKAAKTAKRSSTK